MLTDDSSDRVDQIGDCCGDGGDWRSCRVGEGEKRKQVVTCVSVGQNHKKPIAEAAGC